MNANRPSDSPAQNATFDGDSESDVDPQPFVTAEDTFSSGTDGEEMAHSARADSPTTSQETSGQLPHMSEKDVLAAGLRAFGTETHPYSTNTKAAAIAKIMAFVISEGLSWKGLDNLMVMANAFFAPETAIFPPSRYLFR